MEFREEIFEGINLFQQVVIELDNGKEISIKNEKRNEEDKDVIIITGVGQDNKVSDNIEKSINFVINFINRRKLEIVSVV